MKLEKIGYVKPHPPREPLRNIGEIAEIFGVPMAKMRTLLANKKAPKPALKGSKGGQYRMSEVALWWGEWLKEQTIEKKCCRCGTVKPITEFYKVTKEGQLRALCKPCNVAYIREMRKNRDKP